MTNEATDDGSEAGSTGTDVMGPTSASLAFLSPIVSMCSDREQR